MKQVNDDESTFNNSRRIIHATLSIPEHAVHVTAAPPETITQRNVEAVTGLSVRAYLEAVRDPGFPLKVTKLGKWRIVNRAAFITWLEKGAFGGGRKEEQNDVFDDDGATDNESNAEQADDILDALGLHQGPAKMKKGKTSTRG